MTALDDACEITGDSKTDTINRALQLYAFIQKRLEEGDSIRLVGDDGQEREVHLF